MGRLRILLLGLALAPALLTAATAQGAPPRDPDGRPGAGFTPLDKRKQAFFAHVDEFGTDAGVLDMKPASPFLDRNGLPTSLTQPKLRR